MALQEKLKDDMKVAMKSGDTFSLGVLRMITAGLTNKSIEKRGKGLAADITDEEVVAQLALEAKRRTEAALVYEKGGRADLAEHERKEAAFIKTYLPAQLSEAEIIAAVEAIIAKVRTTGADASFTGIIKEAMKELKGKANGKVVGEIIKKKLGE